MLESCSNLEPYRRPCYIRSFFVWDVVSSILVVCCLERRFGSQDVGPRVLHLSREGSLIGTQAVVQARIQGSRWGLLACGILLLWVQTKCPDFWKLPSSISAPQVCDRQFEPTYIPEAPSIQRSSHQVTGSNPRPRPLRAHPAQLRPAV